jgi:hypothetical protein
MNDTHYGVVVGINRYPALGDPIRRELHPMQLPRISADDWSHPPGPPALVD